MKNTQCSDRTAQSVTRVHGLHSPIRSLKCLGRVGPLSLPFHSAAASSGAGSGAPRQGTHRAWDLAEAVHRAQALAATARLIERRSLRGRRIGIGSGCLRRRRIGRTRRGHLAARRIRRGVVREPTIATRPSCGLAVRRESRQQRWGRRRRIGRGRDLRRWHCDSSQGLEVIVPIWSLKSKDIDNMLNN